MRANIALCFLTVCHIAAVLAQNKAADLLEHINTERIVETTKTCITSRGDAGSCVGRIRCDYGTQNIDFTLYVPRGYVKQCFDDDVCCPPNFVTPEPERLFTLIDDDYDFDDDD